MDNGNQKSKSIHPPKTIMIPQYTCTKYLVYGGSDPSDRSYRVSRFLHKTSQINNNIICEKKKKNRN